MPSLLVLLGINKVLIVYFCWFFSPLQELVQWHGLHLLVELFQENMEMGCQKVLELHWRYFPQLLEKKGGGRWIRRSRAAAQGFPAWAHCGLGQPWPWQGPPQPCPGLCCWPGISQPFIICLHRESVSGDWKNVSNDLVDLQMQIPTFLHSYLFFC